MRTLSGNQYLTLASTFHGLHAIAKQLSPVTAQSSSKQKQNKGGKTKKAVELFSVGDGGIELLEADTFRLQCYSAPTGTKFFLIFSPDQQNVAALLKTVYELYADYVMKNPFYEVEMPIHCDLFSVNLDKVVTETSKQ